MDDLILPAAYRIRDDIWRAECPATHETFEAVALLHTEAAGLKVVYLPCGCCDKYMRTGDAYDPTQPQPHPYREGGQA